MTLISVILIIVFGLNPSEGDYTVDVIDENNNDDDEDDNDDDEDNNADDDYNKDDNNNYDNNDNNENNKKIIVIDPRYSNSNTKNIYISTDGDIDVDEGMLNYSHFSPNSSSKRRGNYYKNKHQPKEPETSSTNTFLNNMFKKIL